MVPESLLYLPLTLHTGAESAKTYAPMLATAALPDSGLSAYVLTRTLGSLKQGLYVLDGRCWRFTMPQPVLSDVLIRGSSVDVYLGIASPITVSPTTVVYKNGILFGPRILQGPGIFCVLSPQSSVEATYLKAARPLSGHRVLKITPDGADYASSAIIADAASVIGISVDAADAGQPIKIQTAGELSEPSWAWTVGQPVYNGVDGVLTQVGASAGYSLVVGVAIEATSILVAMKQPIVLI